MTRLLEEAFLEAQNSSDYITAACRHAPGAIVTEAKLSPFETVLAIVKALEPNAGDIKDITKAWKKHMGSLRTSLLKQYAQDEGMKAYSFDLTGADDLKTTVDVAVLPAKGAISFGIQEGSGKRAYSRAQRGLKRTPAEVIKEIKFAVKLSDD